MITKTQSGVVYPSLTYAQNIQYASKPNALMSAIKNTTLSQEHTEAMTQHTYDDIKVGRDFAEKAAQRGDWGNLPRQHHIDEWA